MKRIVSKSLCIKISVHLFRVVGGLDTLAKMEKVATDDKDRPVVC